jgi:SNF2 family DNA or RNA helicase
MSAFSPLQPQPQNDDIIDLISSDEEEQQQQQQQQVEIHQYECWICEVPLCNPISTSRNLQVSCYAVHTHPTLKVPVCCVCSDQVTANLLSQKENAKEENELCSVCARVPEKDLLFLCDNPSCESFQSQEEEEEGTKLPQQICAKCVTQRAKPMIDPHLLQTQLLHQEVSWHCICCNPTKSIQLLQLLLESISSESSTSTASIEDILGDLETVEAKKRDCEELLEHEDDYRDEIKQELLEEEQVDAEFTEWKTLQMHHYTRLCDMITKLQEDAERLGFNLKEHYLSGSQHQQSLEAEPLWKQEADQACRERERQERKCPPVMRKQSPHPNEQALLLYNVDDLGSLSSKSESEEEEEERAQWRSAQHRVPHWQLQEAMQEEDDLRASLQMKKPSTIPERLDVDALKEEDYKASKVRTDSLTILRNCHKTKSKQKRPPQIIAKTNNNTPTCSPVLRHAKSAFSPPKKRSRSTAFRRINSHTFKSEKNDTNVAAAAATTMEQSSSTQQLQVSPEVLFDNSNCVLSTNSHQQTVSVATSLAAKLKPHQKEGIQFMFDNSFQDLANPQEDHSKSIGGCILAHNMGLGKSLSCVALIHTLFYHPVLTASYQNKIQTVILVVPVNTLVNWENEVDKWTKDIGRLRIINLAERTNRERAIEEWDEQGGILLTSDALFRSVIKRLTSHAHFLQKTNVIILDEAHIMLKNKTNEVFKALTSVQTKRRICLTGSPFQNNLFEFFRMASYIRPGVLGISERTFEGNFVLPILSGMTSDASAEAKERADRLLKEIQESLAPFVQRKDASVLLKDLPPMQQVVLSIRPTRVQSRLYGAYKRYQRASNDKDASNFFKMYSTLRSVHNHPGTLLLYRSTSSSLPSQTVIATPSRDENALQSVSKEENDRNLANIKHELLEERLEEILPLPHNTAISPAMSNEQEQHNIIDLISDSEEESSEEDLVSNEWWTRAAQKSGLDQLEDICSGNKVVLLLHILCHASLLDEKVVLFSQCLKVCIYSFVYHFFLVNSRSHFLLVILDSRFHF